MDIFTVAAEIQVPLSHCTAPASLNMTTVATHGDAIPDQQLAERLLMPGGDHAAGGDEGDQAVGGDVAAGVGGDVRRQVNIFSSKF